MDNIWGVHGILQHYYSTGLSKEPILMIDEIKKLLDDYAAWLRDKTAIRQIQDWAEITTPYLDRNNDYIQIYARKMNGDFLITDDGNTITELEQVGCKLESKKRTDLLKMTLNGFGVKLNKDALEIKADSSNFAHRKHNLIQAVLAVNDMFYLAEPMAASFFYEDVAKWFDINDIRYTPKVKFTGKTGYDHLFDFVIPKSRQSPEKIVQAINRPSKDTAQAIAFSWVDTKEVRSDESVAYALLNDRDRSISTNVLDALKNYDVTPVAWSDRENVRLALAA